MLKTSQEFCTPAGLFSGYIPVNYIIRHIQYHGCWWPGSLHRQVITSADLQPWYWPTKYIVVLQECSTPKTWNIYSFTNLTSYSKASNIQSMKFNEHMYVNKPFSANILLYIWEHPWWCVKLTHWGLVTPCGIRVQGSWSTLIQAMACCLTAPSHYLNQC